MKYTALVPIKSLAEAKSRLATHLTQAQRAALMLEMLHHVLCILQKSNEFTYISVVSADTRVLEYAQEHGARGLREEQAGHNPALTAAALRELADGTTTLLTISADLPLLQTHNIHELLAQSRQHAVVLAASQDGTGTNALLLRPPLALPYVFGEGSLQHFQSEAEQRQLSKTIYHSIETALDIDTIHDLEQFRNYEIGEKKVYTAPCL